MSAKANVKHEQSKAAKMQVFCFHSVSLLKIIGTNGQNRDSSHIMLLPV